MINWLKYRWLYFALSLALIGAGSHFLFSDGFRLGLDFTGGSLLEFKVGAGIDELRPVISQTVEIASLQQSSEDSFILRTGALDTDTHTRLTEQLTQQFGSLAEISYETVGPVLGRELITKALFGLGLGVLFILLYLTIRFKDKSFGICAVLAMLHDSLIILGAFSFLGTVYQVEIDSLFVTAVLTILSFSVHDTIVLYDRIRENQRIHSQDTLAEGVNRSISETMTRSVNNSLTIIFMLLALFLLGGETTKWFVLALLIGTVSGTYSSPFVAAPLLLLFKKKT